MTSKPSLTNCPKLSSPQPPRPLQVSGELGVRHAGCMKVIIFAALREKMRVAFAFAQICQPYTALTLSPPKGGRGVTYSGGYSGGVPPLPIPNREVKPARADGTAHPWESR